MSHITGDAATAPLLPPGRGRRLAPYAALTALGVALAWADTPALRGYWFAAGALSAALGLACLALPWRRWPPGWQAAPALAYFAVAGPVRLAGGGAVFVALALLPVLWLAVFHAGRALRAGLVLLAVVLIAGYDRPPPTTSRASRWRSPWPAPWRSRAATWRRRSAAGPATSRPRARAPVPAATSSTPSSRPSAAWSPWWTAAAG
ncbi:hypothetical protein GCM10010124_21680 [Pilimelia terevasa]|uniref:Uncharacterized protein n=1 Tax=Pilimelia terevasa TaxID=53372 RepID=A0A8J3BKD3_9ACTN|nr:hypothetical protein GCM10010124_21680 [Pilimelia terevasa]